MPLIPVVAFGRQRPPAYVKGLGPKWRVWYMTFPNIVMSILTQTLVWALHLQGWLPAWLTYSLWKNSSYLLLMKGLTFRENRVKLSCESHLRHPRIEHRHQLYNLGCTWRELRKYFETTWEVLKNNLWGTWRQHRRYLEATGEVLGDNLGGAWR